LIKVYDGKRNQKFKKSYPILIWIFATQDPIFQFCYSNG
jgi:hypothetical protein